MSDFQLFLAVRATGIDIAFTVGGYRNACNFSQLHSKMVQLYCSNRVFMWAASQEWK